MASFAGNNTNDKKRQRENDVESSEDAPSNIWPRVFIISGTDNEKPLKKLSPFAVSKSISAIVGHGASVKRLKSGDLLVTVTHKHHSEALSRTTSLVTTPVRITPHKSLNSCKGVIKSRDLSTTDEKEILDNLRPQGVTGVRCISITKNGSRVRTNTIILTFGHPVLPQSVRCGYLSLPVSQYIPNPLRCFKCQKYGHHKDNCRDEHETCAKCASPDHCEIACASEHLKCVNCNGEHGSFSRKCPVWEKEKRIQEVRVTQGLSFPEARKIVATASSSGPSYSQVARRQPKTSSMACQTDLTWVKNDRPQTMIQYKMNLHSHSVATQSVEGAISEEQNSSKKGDSRPPSSNTKKNSKPKAHISNPIENKKPKKLKQLLRHEMNRGRNPFSPLTDLELQLHADDDLDDMETASETIPELPPLHP